MANTPKRVHLSANELLALRPKVEEIELPGLGLVRVRALNGVDRDWLDGQAAEHGDLRKVPSWRAKIAQRVLIDEKGNPLFTPAQIKDLSILPGEVLDPIVTRALKMSSLSRSAEQKEAAGNSQPGTDGSSSSDSAGQ